MCLPAKIVPQKKASGLSPLGAFLKNTFVLFFGLSPKCEGKIRVKEGFCAPKAKIVPEKKQEDRHHGDAFVINTFSLVFIPEDFFLPHQNFVCPPPPPQHTTLAPSLHP